MRVTPAPSGGWQGFDVPEGRAATGRWVRIVATPNHGDEVYWELMGVRGMRVQLSSTPLQNASSTYDGGNYERFRPLQPGAQLTECQE